VTGAANMMMNGGSDMQGYPQPKVHPGAMAAMQAGVGGLHRPMPAAPSVGPSIMQPQPMMGVHQGAPQQQASAPQHPKFDHQVSPMLMQLMLHLPRPQVAQQAPPPHAVGAAVLAHLLQLRGGGR
jgi:hypothetical protein